jgi:hypothetical protein
VNTYTSYPFISQFNLLAVISFLLEGDSGKRASHLSVAIEVPAETMHVNGPSAIGWIPTLSTDSLTKVVVGLFSFSGCQEPEGGDGTKVFSFLEGAVVG